MGRREKPLDPTSSPLAAYAVALRELRDDSGITNQELATKASISTSTLSRATGGVDMPSEAVVRSFVAACDGDVDHFLRRRRDLAQPPAPSTPAPGPSPIAVPSTVPPTRAVSRRSTAAAAAVAAAAVAAVLLTAVGVAWIIHSSTAAAGRAPTRDGADPKTSGCAADPSTSTLDSRQLDDADGRPRALLELRYSPNCAVAWARVSPLTATSVAAGTRVTIEVVRVSDHRRSSYAAPLVATAVYGNLLRNGRGRCVQAEAVLVTAHHAGPRATTGCWAGRQLRPSPTSTARTGSH